MLARLLLVIGSSALAVFVILGAESTHALVCTQLPHADPRPSCVSRTPTGGFCGATASVVIDGSRVSVNSSGYRGRELATSRPPGRDSSRRPGRLDRLRSGCLRRADFHVPAGCPSQRDRGRKPGGARVRAGPGADRPGEQGPASQPGCRRSGLLSGQRSRRGRSSHSHSTTARRRNPGSASSRIAWFSTTRGLRQTAARRGVQWVNDRSHLYNRLTGPRLSTRISSRLRPGARQSAKPFATRSMLCGSTWRSSAA